MLATITYIKLKSYFAFFPLSMYAMRILKQMKSSGHLDFKKSGVGIHHYTMSLWPDTETMHTFARSGAHLEAMRNSKKIAAEIRTITITADTLPDWTAARQHLQNGKVIKF